MPPECSHCERATLAAMVRMDGSLMISGSGRYRLETNTDSPATARLMLELMHKLYHLHTETIMRRNVLHKTPNYLIDVPMQHNLTVALKDLGIVSENGIEQGIKGDLVEKRCCTAAYLRGAFLGRGFVADPHGDFHFEMTASNAELAEGLSGLMQKSGTNAHVMRRRNDFIVYLKSGPAISDFLALVGAHSSMLKMEEVLVIKSVRNQVNRQTNADIANSQRTIDANTDQLRAMRAIVDHGGFYDLPPALRQILQLRMENPQLSLKELGDRSKPRLSKSAVYHRIRRIEQIARKYDDSLS